ncbi:hypothetical protein ACROYT_G015550 [Oculina patagonica]
MADVQYPAGQGSPDQGIQPADKLAAQAAGGQVAQVVQQVVGQDALPVAEHVAQEIQQVAAQVPQQAEKRAAKQLLAIAENPVHCLKERARQRRPRPDKHDMVIASTAIEPAKEDSQTAQGTTSEDSGAISCTFSTVLSQAIKTAFTPVNLASLIGSNAQPLMPDTPLVVDRVVQDVVLAITINNAQSGTEGVLNTICNLVSTDPNDPRPQSLFTSVSVPFTSRLNFTAARTATDDEFHG